LDERREIGDRLIPLAESELSEAPELDRGEVVWPQFQRFVQISQGRIVLFEFDLSLSAFQISGRIFRSEYFAKSAIAD